MPLVMQNTMQVMQQQMADLMPKVLALSKDAASQAQALDNKASDIQSPNSQPPAAQ